PFLPDAESGDRRNRGGLRTAGHGRSVLADVDRTAVAPSRKDVYVGEAVRRCIRYRTGPEREYVPARIVAPDETVGTVGGVEAAIHGQRCGSRPPYLEGGYPARSGHGVDNLVSVDPVALRSR